VGCGFAAAVGGLRRIPGRHENERARDDSAQRSVSQKFETPSASLWAILAISIPSRDSLPNDQLEEIDRWMLDRTAELVKKCREWYANYEFHRVYHAIHDYCVVDLSSFYFDVLKDRLYTKAPETNRAAPHKPLSGNSLVQLFDSLHQFSFSPPKKSGVFAGN